MAADAEDFNFDEYDKPGAERSRRRRGDADGLESDLEEDLLEEDWLSAKKNPSEMSDEELNDDLLQSDDEDLNVSGQDAAYSMGASYDQQDSLQEADYTDDVVNLGAEGYEEEEGYNQDGEEAYAEEYNQGHNTEMDQIDYSGEPAGGEDGYQYEVLDIEIGEPIDGEFQEFQRSNGDEPLNEAETSQEEEAAVREQQEKEEPTEEHRFYETEEVENETLPGEQTQEESDEEDDEGEESGRIRFKSERKEGAVVRLADAGSKRRNIPETLELSEKAKKDLLEFEEHERQKRHTRHGGRGRGAGIGGGGGGGRGGRGRGGFPGYGMADFRGGQRRKMHDHMLPLMGNMNLQQSSRMPSPHQQHLHSHQHHPSRPRGPPPFQEHGRSIPQQPLQPLIPPHMAHRSPQLRPQMEQPPPRMMSSPPPSFPQHHQQQPSQPKNIHINPHFRGPAQSSVQVPLMPPAQSQSRPAVGPQRFPGLGDFQPHMPANFGPSHRLPHHMEPLRNQPPQGPQDREPIFMGGVDTDCGESSRFPGQHMFDHPGPGSLMNSGNNLHHQQQLPGQGHMGFGPPGPPFNQPGQGPLGHFQREPPRPNLPPHQGHHGMANMNQQGGPPNQPRPFMNPRQPFGQQGSTFPPPPFQFGMQGLLQTPPVNQLTHHDPLSPHSMHQQQPHHHRQEMPHQQHQQINLNEPRPMSHHGQNPFHQQQGHGGPRHTNPRSQNPPQRNMSNRQRMSTPVSKQMQHRNSNLRELPVAPGNTNMNSSSPAANIKPVARTTPGTRPGQNAQLAYGGGRGRGQAAKTEPQAGGTGRVVTQQEAPNASSSLTPEDPNEDEETRQYRLKIEEQKRLREEILRKKELRRQMQAGVRKKELLERLNAQSNTPNQDTTPTQAQPLQPNQQKQQPEQKVQQLQTQQQRIVAQRPQQSVNHTLTNPNLDSAPPPCNPAQNPALRPNIKSRLQMVKGNTQEQQTPSSGPEQQWKPPQQNQQQLLQQQRRNSSLQTVNRPGAQVPPKNAPPPGPSQTQGPKSGAKRTVMQRAKSSDMEAQHVPQKVRVVKLSGPSGKGPEASSSPVQQQGTWQAAPVNQSIQRKVTMMGQQQTGPGGAPEASCGGTGDTQQSRVVVSGRGRGRGIGRGQPLPTRQSQRGPDNAHSTVCIQGLSSSTTENQLKNLLMSIGPVEMFKMMPQQRKAIAKFSNPQHAASFQMSFHRHMIDLSHIDVSLIDG
ncbi:RNA-binding protein 33 isoform X3 [Cyprinodon tularosa]|uniref:RNA-binding protein 33 isoform X3 n=1 Tax=Cyprinodon tularosa TaxID=77115 RepID=UPI0018E21D95|nr:RNA-binding protein 33 isoform X3 [Cyprinodon tularosa]